MRFWGLNSNGPKNQIVTGVKAYLALTPNSVEFNCYRCSCRLSNDLTARSSPDDAQASGDLAARSNHCEIASSTRISFRSIEVGI
jgi:hypothetical protein